MTRSSGMQPPCSLRSTSAIDTQPSQSSPSAFYQERLAYWRTQASDAASAEDRIASARLLTSFALVAATVWAVGYSGPGWLIAPVTLGFAYLVYQHSRVRERKRRAEDGTNYIEHALSRFTDQWAGRGPTEDFAADDHPYAADLDVFGEGGLFDLLCTAQTLDGQHKFAQWLLSPASVDQITQRQAAVQWLTQDAQLREQMALLACQHQQRSGMSANQLASWGAANESRLNSHPLASVAAWILSLTFVGTIALWALTDFGAIGLLVNALLAWWVHFYYREPLAATLSGLDTAERELGLVADLMARVELTLADKPSAPLLQQLAANLGIRSETAASEPASTAIRQLKSNISWLEARSNQLVALFAYLTGWSLHWGCAIDRWRSTKGPRLCLWLDTLAEFEALNALAQLAFDHPDYCYPQVNSGAKAAFVGESLGHPLLSTDECITNDVALTGELQVLLISGSNMSGKSTLMRTIGVNTVLALAGAVVCARALALSRLQVGATLRIQDSLRDGQSRFYAEIKRLKQIVDLSQTPTPLLFLLDEVLSGTNSHDRQIGAEQIIRGLIEAGAIGVVTTHDLALAKAADALAPSACNLHFRDRMVDGEIQFDYQLHPGVVAHSNALELMRSIGLAVN